MSFDFHLCFSPLFVLVENRLKSVRPHIYFIKIEFRPGNALRFEQISGALVWCTILCLHFVLLFFGSVQKRLIYSNGMVANKRLLIDSWKLRNCHERFGGIEAARLAEGAF